MYNWLFQKKAGAGSVFGHMVSSGRSWEEMPSAGKFGHCQKEKLCWKQLGANDTED